MKKYIAHIMQDDGDMFIKLMTAEEVIKMTNLMDIYDIAEIVLFQTVEFGVLKKLTYVGWQPNCLIEYKDETGEVVLFGYGEDH